jgi:hypothetical protein
MNEEQQEKEQEKEVKKKKLVIIIFIRDTSKLSFFETFSYSIHGQSHSYHKIRQ